jgi:putative DNA methylase
MIGSGMAVFSSYAKVTEPDGEPMRVRTALGLINQVLAEVLTGQEGDFDTDTRWCVQWFAESGWEDGPYERAETLANALNTSVAGLERAVVARARAGKARLIAPEDLPADYDPVTDERPTVWEVVAHMSRRLESGGVEAAGAFLARAAQRLDVETAKELAYLGFSLSEKRKKAADALRFNALVTSWPDIVAASKTPPRTPDAQAALDFGQAG